MLLLLVAFCLVTDVHKFYFKRVLNKTPNKWRTVRSNGLDRDVLWQDTVSSWQSYTANNGLYLHCKGQSCSPDSTIISGKERWGKCKNYKFTAAFYYIFFKQIRNTDMHYVRSRSRLSNSTVYIQVPAECKELIEAPALNFSQQRCLRFTPSGILPLLDC